MGQRKYPRIQMNTEASIRCGERRMLGILSDLSLNGIYIKMNTPIPRGNDVEVTFYDTASLRKPAVKVCGSVVRTDNDGIAFQFKQIDVDSFINVRLIMAKHSATV